MNDCKMYKMSADMECQRPAEDSEEGVYLSSVRKHAQKDSITKKVIMLILKLLFSYSISCFVFQWAVRIAYIERGYKAYGGEYMLAVATFMITYFAINKLLNIFGGLRHGKERDRRNAE